MKTNKNVTIYNYYCNNVLICKIIIDLQYHQFYYFLSNFYNNNFNGILVNKIQTFIYKVTNHLFNNYEITLYDGNIIDL